MNTQWRWFTFEYKVANQYGFSARLDNYTIPGLRIGISGFYGNSMHNAAPQDQVGHIWDKTYQVQTDNKKTYNDLKGRVMIESVDFTYKGYNWIVRGQADYGKIDDPIRIKNAKASKARMSGSPYSNSNIGEKAMAIGIEAGYDIFSQIHRLKADKQKLYVFGRYEHYNPYIPADGDDEYQFTEKKRVAMGINYHPIPQIAIKGEFSKRFLKSQYNNEPSINIGIAYEGFFM